MPALTPLAKLVAGKPGPVQGVLALLDPLLRRATAIVKADYSFGVDMRSWIPDFSS